jgi:hypothetical protein
VVETAIVGAGAPNGLDIQPLGSTCIDLAVAVTRDQHLGAMAWVARFFNEGRHEMLAVPHREDDRHFHLFVNVRRFHRDPACAPDQPKIRRCRHADSLVKGG